MSHFGLGLLDIVTKKLDPFSFEHNFGKYCPIFTARCRDAYA